MKNSNKMKKTQRSEVYMILQSEAPPRISAANPSPSLSLMILLNEAFYLTTDAQR